MRSFTHSCSVVFSLLTGAFLLIFSSQINAQSHVLTVTEPASIAGNYAAEMATFGRNFCTVTGELLQAKDASNGTKACNATPIVTNLTGKIAVIDRGDCDFSDKVLNAQKKGAIAVIVVSDRAANLEPVLPSMGRSASGSGDQVTIPSFIVSRATGDKIKPLLNNAVKVNITSNTTSFGDPNLVVWGNKPKEGDFDGGLNGWKSNTVSCTGKPNTATAWSWMSASSFPDPCGGVTFPGQTTFLSPTRCNGSMIMNAAALDLASITACSGIGQGPCPAPHVGELISPVIKVTKGTPLNVSFYQALAQFGSEYFVEWSKDGGKTWTSIQINEEYRTYEENSDPYKAVRLIGSETADSIQLKFRYDGYFYYWAIDDVKLVKREANNMAVTEYYAVSPNFQQPLAQVEPIPFSAAVENVGTATQTKVKLYINAIDSTTNTRIFQDSLIANSSVSSQIDTAIFDPKFVPNKKGTYALVYQVAADSADYDRFDNVQGQFFRVTDTTYAKELGRTQVTAPGSGNWDINEPHSAAYGNSYHVIKGKGNYLRSVTFGVNNGAELQGLDLLFSLYKWEDRNFNANAEPGERTLIADNYYTIKGTETGARLITLPFPEPGEDPVELEDSTNYLIVCEYFTGDDTDLEFLINDTYDRFPMLFTSFLVGEPRYASVTELDSDLSTATYAGIGYGWENTYVLRMNVGPLVITSDKALPSITNEFAISPNPAREKVYLQLALDKVAKQANVRIMDLAGRTVVEKAYNNIQKDQLQFSVDGLPSGTYLMQVTTESGTGTKKFVVAGK